MDRGKLWDIHKEAKEKINMIYLRSNGRIGHCYLDPKQPLKRSIAGLDTYGYVIDNKKDFIAYTAWKVGVFKQVNNVMIFVDPDKLWLHSGTNEGTVKILYG